MLELIFLLLVLSIIHLILIPKDKIYLIKKTALYWSLTIFVSSNILLKILDGEGLLEYFKNYKWIEPLFDSALFAIDGISIFFILLTTLLTPICVLISWNSIRVSIKEFYLCLLGLEIFLIGVFTIVNIIGFYILFEGLLIPMFLIIGVWGSREEKIQASYYFFFYTFIGSVFMLLAILKVYSYVGSIDYWGLYCFKLELNLQNFLLLGFVISFAIKIPKVPFHIWLPQAHVEAPVAGSVILAGILLKLGGYGIIRFIWALIPEGLEFFSPFLQTFSLLAVIYGSLSTCRQVDLKRIIAYSSVAHMGLVTLGLFSLKIEGLVAAIFMMLAHGLVSSALFIAVTYLYERHYTRIVKYYRGMALTMPIFSLFMLLLILANASIPLSCNFIGEFFSLLAVFEYNIVVGILASSSIVLSACYCIYLYNRICFGVTSKFIYFSRDLNRREFYALLPLLILIFGLGVFSFIVIDIIYGSAIFQK